AASLASTPKRSLPFTPLSASASSPTSATADARPRGASPQGRGACAIVSILARYRERCMSPFDLTNLAALKAWLGLPPAPGPNDATLSALVTAASPSIYAALSRPNLLPFSYAETIDLETNRVTLRHWPVMQVTSVTSRGIAIPPDENADLEASMGYALEPG